MSNRCLAFSSASRTFNQSQNCQPSEDKRAHSSGAVFLNDARVFLVQLRGEVVGSGLIRHLIHQAAQNGQSERQQVLESFALVVGDEFFRCEEILVLLVLQEFEERLRKGSEGSVSAKGCKSSDCRSR